MNSDDAIILSLPTRGYDGHDQCHWWRVAGGHITETGIGLSRFHDGPGGIDPAQIGHVMALAPVESCLLHSLAMPAMPDKQAAAVAQRMIAGDSPRADEVLHIVPVSDDVAATGERAFVSVPAETMAQWQAWLTRHGLTARSIVPAALLIPAGADDMPIRARIGGDDVIRSGASAFPAEPSLVEALCPPDTVLRTMTEDQVDHAIIAACDAPPAELLSGPWAPRRRLRFDGADWTRAAKLAAALALVSILIPLILIIRLHHSADQLDEETVAMAVQMGAPTSRAEDTIAAADRRLAQLGTGPALVTTPIAALVQAMEAAPTVNLDTISWRGDGILSVTLGGPRNEDINPVLEAIQRAGYRITAQARVGTDGRALADITIRSGP